MPMQKMSTSSKKTELFNNKKQQTEDQALQPKAITLTKILQFAASYKVEKTADNQYIEWFLN